MHICARMKAMTAAGTDQTPHEPASGSPAATLMLEAARLYYEQDQTQGEIARRLGTSRSTVSRLLRDARRLGVVRITLDYQWARDKTLESDLVNRFGLREARVLQNPSYTHEELLDGLGRLAADLLAGEVREGMILGVSYGHSIAATVAHLQPRERVRMTVVQIIGALGSADPRIEGGDLTRELALAFGGEYRYLFAPLMVESERARDVILQEPLVRETIDLGRAADLTLIGIGSPSSVSFWSGYLSHYDLSKLRLKGAVGHMCAEFFDHDGKVLDIPINKRSVSIGLESLRAAKRVVAVAGGPEKADAIAAALRGGYIDVLVTDEFAARSALG